MSLVSKIYEKGRKGIVRIAGTALLSALALIGCEEYNKADISDDGNKIAFSLNREGGFSTDSGSEIYVLDVKDIEKPKLKRMTLDNYCDAWAEFSPNSESLMYVKTGKAESGGSDIYTADLEGKEEQLQISGLFMSRYINFPLWINEESVFFSSAGVKEEMLSMKFNYYSITGSAEEKVFSTSETFLEVKAAPLDPPNTKGLHEFLASTTPAFSNGIMYYMTAFPEFRVEESKEIGENPSILYSVRAVDMNTKQDKLITKISFAKDFYVEKEKTDLENSSDESGLSYVDITVSPDDKIMICCFLPGQFFQVDGFNDKINSLVYAVNLENGEAKLLSQDINMYNPRFLLPFRAKQEEQKVKVEGEVQEGMQNKNLEEKIAQEYRFLFLSGTGYGEEGGRSVYISDGKGNRKELARFPDKLMSAYTGWTLLSPERLRIYQVGEGGIIVADVNLDGTDKVPRILNRENLRKLKKGADLEAIDERFFGSITDILKEMSEITGIEIKYEETVKIPEILIQKANELKEEAAKVKFEPYIEPELHSQ